jgi:AraC-like DNA-binding protein
VEVVVSRRFQISERWDFDICSPFWRLYVNRDTGAQLWLEGEVIALQPDVVYLIPAGLQFRTGVENSGALIVQDYVHFNVHGLPAGILRRAFSKPIRLAMTGDLKAQIISWRRRLDAADESFGSTLRTVALVNLALAAAYDSLSSDQRQQLEHWFTVPMEIAPAIRKIDEQLEQAPTIAELARLCQISQRQLLRRFQEWLGISPSQLILERRIARSAESLACSDETIENIAESCGFADRFHFSKIFRQRVGVPPGAYRRMHRESLGYGDGGAV